MQSSCWRHTRVVLTAHLESLPQFVHTEDWIPAVDLHQNVAAHITLFRGWVNGTACVHVNLDYVQALQYGPS